MFQVNDGPTLPASAARWKRSLNRSAETPIVPLIEMCGIELGLGNADLRAWAAACRSARRMSGRRREQLGRNAHGHFRRRRGDRSPSRAGLQVLRRNAQQHAQCVGVLPQGNLQLGDGRLGLLQRAAGLGHVDFADDAGLELPLGDFQGLPLAARRSPGRT